MATTSKTVSKSANKEVKATKAPAKKVSGTSKAKTTVEAKSDKKPTLSAAKMKSTSNESNVKVSAEKAPAKKIAAKKVAAKKIVSKVEKPTIEKTKKVDVVKKDMKTTEPVSKAAPSKKVDKKIEKTASEKEIKTVKKIAPKVENTVAEKSKEIPVKAKKRAAKKEEKPAVLLSAREEIADAFVEKPTLSNKKNTTVVVPSRGRNKSSDSVDEILEAKFNTKPRSILDEPNIESQNRKRYSDDDLTEFKELIQGRLEKARKELFYLQGLITRKDEAGTEDTDNRFNHSEDGSGAMEREQLSQLAGRQIQFINHLEKALVRIENKTYGICRVTGELIDKARLRAVPHATLSIEAKNSQRK